MDIRRIQITGGSSYMITLPKDWAESVGLNKNDPVGLKPQPDGTMILYPGGSESEAAQSVKIIQTDGITDRDFLYRQLVGAYIAGHDIIELRSESEMSSMVASTASSFTQTAIGLEIMEENDTSIVIKDLMDQNEMMPMKSVERMKVLTRNMLNDVINSLESRDPSTLKYMNDRDREVDRLDWLISRQVNIHQKDITISRRMGLDLCEVSRCGSVSRTIERIGDHAVLLASNLVPLIEDSSADVGKDIVSLGRDVVALFVDSVGTWMSKDMTKANTCIERGEELVERSVRLGEQTDSLDGRTALATELIAASVKRVAEYSMDIGEIAINSAMD